MSNVSKYKNGWLLLLFVLVGIVLGGLIASLTAGIPALDWLAYSNTFGLNGDSPLVLDLGVLVITFGLQIKITVASIIGVILAIIIYRFI